MKKLITLCLFLVSSYFATAQTAVISLMTAPCHNDGVITVGFTGMTPPLTVNWITYGTSGTTIVHTGVSGLSDILTGYSGGPIMVLAHGSTDTTSTYGYFAGAPPFTYVGTSTAAVCPGLGTDSISVFGGTAPYTYYWYNKASMAMVGTGSTIHVPVGDYGCTITDASGCTFGSTVNPDYMYVDVIAPFHDSMVSTAASCTNGSANAYPSGGGVAPFSYIWSNGATTPAITGLVRGFYSVTIFDGNGCSALGYVFVPQSVAMGATVTPTPATCLASDGAATVFGFGGLPPYSYLWSNGATTQTQTGLHSGVLTVRVTDANGCIGDDTTAIAVSTPITATYYTTPSLCTSPTGTATLALAGGTSPYTIQWVTFPVQTSITATALAAGNYDFRVTDAMGCIQAGTVVVPPINVISLSYTTVPALCTLANGSMSVVPVGGVAPYTFLWSTGATTSGISSAPSGGYGVTITDAMSCKITKSLLLPSTSPLNAAAFTTPASCIFTADGKDSVNAWGGTPPYHYSWTNGGTTRTITGLPTDDYWVTVSDAIGCVSPYIYTHVGYDTAGTSCYCTINGQVYADYNNNCTQDVGEPGIPNIRINISGRPSTFTDPSGFYSTKVPVGSFTVSESVLAYYPLASCQTNNIPVTVAGGGCILTQDFANTIDTIHDMHISTWPYLHNAPVVGHLYTQISIVSNDGTVLEDSVVIGSKSDGQLLSPWFVPGSLFTGSAYQYNAGNVTMGPGATKQYYTNYLVPTNIPLGTFVAMKDTVSFKGDMTNWLADYSPWNNLNSRRDSVIGSFDPNFKAVSPKGVGAAGTITYSDSVLEYMVHFQNTGSYMAENIVVIDTLDDNLDWTTMRPVYQSAKCQVTLAQVGTRHVAKFTFNNINLVPESADEMLSNGMFTYTVHLKRRLAIGTQIKNNASIYFDYNAPVKTNTTLNTIGALDPYTFVNNVNEVGTMFSVYPNPADKNFNAIITSVSGGAATIELSDVTGKVLVHKNTTLHSGSNTVAVDLAGIAPGTYFVTCIGNGKTATQKLVIMK